jgi:7-keto-8-aminopelargonate synthetase-like enzyme
VLQLFDDYHHLVDEHDAVISDELNHASIIDGIRLCKAQRLRFTHMDVNDLERKLVETKGYRNPDYSKVFVYHFFQTADDE